MYIFVYVCVYIYIYIYIMYVYMCVCVYIYIYVYVYLCICMYVCMYICMCIYVYIYIYIYIYTYIHTYIYAEPQVPVPRALAVAAPRRLRHRRGVRQRPAAWASRLPRRRPRGLVGGSPRGAVAGAVVRPEGRARPRAAGRGATLGAGQGGDHGAAAVGGGEALLLTRAGLLLVAAHHDRRLRHAVGRERRGALHLLGDGGLRPLLAARRRRAGERVLPEGRLELPRGEAQGRAHRVLQRLPVLAHCRLHHLHVGLQRAEVRQGQAARAHGDQGQLLVLPDARGRELQRPGLQPQHPNHEAGLPPDALAGELQRPDVLLNIHMHIYIYIHI